ncbi:DUF1376 domain-containing protein [Lysobacter cavernae]|uniref:DUF1376 domain-containing protein n=1 Tax=Lysobacter cavernae TaxID=1685901 RepID=A0ABV7RLF9_9GAMM
MNAESEAAPVCEDRGREKDRALATHNDHDIGRPHEAANLRQPLQSRTTIEDGELLAPLVPAEVDLRGFNFMPLDVRRLLTSRTWIEAADNPRIAHASMCLWAESWHQVPAASLPDSDKVLARLTMVDLKTWKKIRSQVLAGWMKCNDGLLYHPVVAEKARDAWEHKVRQRARTKAATEARRNTRPERYVERDDVCHEKRNRHRDVHQETGQGQDRDKTKNAIAPDGLPLAERALMASAQLPTDVDPAAWELFDQHHCQQGKWTTARRMLALGQLRTIANNGHNPNEVLIWATARGLADLADAARRMVADAAKETPNAISSFRRSLSSAERVEKNVLEARHRDARFILDEATRLPR